MSWNYLGNEAALALLRSHIAQGTMRQAYLFSGPSGIGRRTLALRFAQAVNCLNPPQAGDFCGLCRSCKLINEMRHPDLDIVQAEQRGGTLRVEQIRELQHRLSLAPYEANYRIALLLRFEEANQNAQNALLKTLEEPPQRVILCLTTADSESLLPTIVSRCEVIRLRPLATQALTDALVETHGIEQKLASQLARLAASRPGIAFQLLQDPERLQAQKQLIQEHFSLLETSYLERFAIAERFAKERSKAEIVSLLEGWLTLWRDVLLWAHDDHDHLTYGDFEREIAAIADQLGSEQSLQVLAYLRQTLDHLQSNINLRLALEVLFLNLPRLSLGQSQTQSSLESAQI